MYREREREDISLSLSLYIYIYMYTCITYITRRRGAALRRASAQRMTRQGLKNLLVISGCPPTHDSQHAYIKFKTYSKTCPASPQATSTGMISSWLQRAFQVNLRRASLRRPANKLWGGHRIQDLDLCVSSLHRGHANIICIVPSLTHDPRRESNVGVGSQHGSRRLLPRCSIILQILLLLLLLLIIIIIITT